MIKRYNNLSLLYGIPGFLLQGLVFVPKFLFFGLLGLVLLIIGLAYYAKSIGRHPAWGLFGLLSWLGIIVILCLKDKTLTPEEKAIKNKTKAKDVILGILLGLSLISLIIGILVIVVIIFNLFIK